MSELPPVEILRRLLRQQLDALRRVPLRSFGAPESAAHLAFDEASLEALWRHRARLLPHLRAGTGEHGRLVAAAASRFGRQIRERSQYVEWDEAAHQRLEPLFATYYARLGELLASAGGVEDLEARLVLAHEGHLGRLARFVSSLWREGAEPNEQIALTDTVSSEYSAGLQLEVLGIEASALQGPVLDLGCGPSALLVHHLRNLGFEAFGLERSPTDARYVWRGDWLKTDFGRDHWGTVIAHLSFTNHFVLHHAASEETAGEYAQAYLRILRSLVLGGSFVYAPGLPFIEGLLPADEFRVLRRELLEAPDEGSIDAVRVVRLR